jgi:hypothetical protein
MDRRATIAQKQRMRGHGFHYMISAEKDDMDAIDAFCKLHGLTRSSVLVRGALALCEQLRHATREWDRHMNQRLRMNAAALARKCKREKSKD